MTRTSAMTVMFLAVILTLWPTGIRAEERGAERAAAGTATPQRSNVDWSEWSLLALADSTVAPVSAAPLCQRRHSTFRLRRAACCIQSLGIHVR